MCQSNSDLQPNLDTENLDWTTAAQSYTNIEEMPTFISRQRQTAAEHVFTTSACPQNLQGTQLKVYSAVKDHFASNTSTLLHIIISGTAGTGKSYLINCLRLLLIDQLSIAAPTGVAAFIIDGQTLHTLLALPTRGDFKDLEGNRLHLLQQQLSSVTYVIVDEMSMVGRRLFGQIDRRLRQVFPHCAHQLFGGRSVLMLGTLVNLPQYWTSPSTPQTPAPICLIKGELHIFSSPKPLP